MRPHTLPYHCLLLFTLGLGISACTPSSAPVPTESAAALPAGWRQIEGQNIPAVASARPQLPATVQSDDA